MSARQRWQLMAAVGALTLDLPVLANPYQLVVGVAPGTAPGPSRMVFPTSGYPGQFDDGYRLGGTPAALPTTYQGQGAPYQAANEFGSLSFMFRRGTVPAGAGKQVPFISTDYLGGPLLDLDGDLGNGVRSLVPVAGRTPTAIPGSSSYVDLSFNRSSGMATLHGLDANGNNAGATQSQPDQVITVNTLAGTSPTGQSGGAINPLIDTRQGTLTPYTTGGLTGVYRIQNLGYEFWQDAITASSGTASTLGTNQFLGTMGGWLIERPAGGSFPTLAGKGLGGTTWPLVDTSHVGQVFNTASGLSPTATITDGVANDVFSAPGNGGLALGAYGGDLGAYLDAVVVPALDPQARSFIYLESAGFGINNSPDPVFPDANGYDVVLIAQSTVPAPASLTAMLLGVSAAAVRRHRRA